MAVLKRVIKLIVSSLVWCGDRIANLGRRVAGRSPRTMGVVLYYHAVLPRFADRFARQMSHLRKNLNLWDLGERDFGKTGSVAVSFDDGYISVVENALPALREHRIPFTMFFTTGSWGGRPCWVHSENHPFYGERVMSEEELIELAKEPLVTIGSHTVTHPKLVELKLEEALFEMRESKVALEELLGRDVQLFSFPHGSCDGQLIDQARSLGYSQVFTIDPSCTDAARGEYVVGRIATEPDDWSIEFRLKAAGAYRWLASQS